MSAPRHLEARPVAGRGRHARSVPGPAGRPIHRTGIHRADGDALLRSLYDQHAEPLFMIALSLTSGDRRLAEDVVRETLLTAWRDVDQIDVAASSLRPWLISIAQRIVRDLSGEPYYSDERRYDDEPPEVFGTDIEPARQRMMVLDGLRTLPGPDREILVEAYFRGRGVRDVADDLGLPPETVKWRLFFALRALQKVLMGAGPTMPDPPGPCVHPDVGPYALGLLEAAERHAYERHLITCAHCLRTLEGLAPLIELLGQVDAATLLAEAERGGMRQLADHPPGAVISLFPRQRDPSNDRRRRPHLRPWDELDDRFRTPAPRPDPPPVPPLREVSKPPKCEGSPGTRARAR
ncbi:sigma-70 family RNA polymerase sigma factor [Phytohabitans flavus]|uniref:sigma-70 family RNA polymerase sigma factor n=1 Tax=Phytohabitans flavus TaxID=1076124 RepID=UPI00364431A8